MIYSAKKHYETVKYIYGINHEDIPKLSLSKCHIYEL